jgi:hypothetical protein
MSATGWSIVQTAARLLERDECDAVLGDLLEAGDGAWNGLLDVVGLLIRRQLKLFKSWRPWLATLGLALPASFVLMGFSISVSWSYRHLLDPTSVARGPGAGAGLILLTSHVLLLIAWSWSAGFVVSTLSRRTLWLSAAACCCACLLCLARFRETSLPSLCLLLYLPPAIAGVRQGLRMVRIKRRSAIMLALGVTLLMLPMWSGGLWAINWVLIWPAWYLVATAQRAGEQTTPQATL